MNKILFLLLFPAFLFSCSDSDDFNAEEIIGSWKLASITPLKVDVADDCKEYADALIAMENRYIGKQIYFFSNDENFTFKIMFQYDEGTTTLYHGIFYVAGQQLVMKDPIIGTMIANISFQKDGAILLLDYDITDEIRDNLEWQKKSGWINEDIDITVNKIIVRYETIRIAY